MMNEEEKETTQEQHLQQQSSSSSAAASPPQLLPKPTRQEVQNCQFSAWYSTFRNLSKKSSINNNTSTTSTTTTSSSSAEAEAEIATTTPSYRNATKYRKNLTIESQIISPLPNEFIDYLKCDGVRLPLCAMNVSSCLKSDSDREEVVVVGDDDGWDDDDKSDNNSDEEDEEVKQYNFPELTQQIQAALQSLSSSTTTINNNNSNNTNIITGCIPKLNWSSPKDATWINCGTLQCKTPGDVYLLLKSSEFIMFDLEKVWFDLDTDEKEEEEEVEVKGDDDVEKDNSNNNSPPPPSNFEYELVLRKWCNLHPSMEFRCFIYNHELIAISQRHPTKFYSHLQLSEEDEYHPTTLIIHSFYKTYIQHRFAHGNMSRYVMDVYVDSQERTWIVDFNVWGVRTDSLLFDWDELMKIGNGVMKLKKEEDCVPMPELRVVTKDMKDLTYDPLSSFRGPTDVMDLLGAGGGSGGDNEGEGGFEGNPSFRQFMEQCVRPSEL